MANTYYVNSFVSGQNWTCIVSQACISSYFAKEKLEKEVLGKLENVSDFLL